jgi:Mn-containing catalase
VYERLTDAGTKDALQFLMTREITLMKAFTAAPSPRQSRAREWLACWKRETR